MKLVINSHTKNKAALDHLLESLQSCDEYNEYEIIVAIGGYYDLPTYEIEKSGNITYIKCNHNSIDYNGLIALLELCSGDINECYMYLHDTCRVGKNFYKKLKEIDLTDVSTIKIHKQYSMNMGVYSQKIINEKKEFLLGKNNTNEHDCMNFKLNAQEDYIFGHDKCNRLLNDYDGWDYTGPTDYYKNGTMRIVEYYPSLDLFKIKANWGQGYWTLSL